MAHSDNLRKKSSKQLGALLVMSQGRCNWCARQIVQLKALPVENVVTVQGYWVFYVVDGLLFRSVTATVDHILPIEMGGTSDIKNLVPACRPCNDFRNRQKGLATRFLASCPGVETHCGNQLRGNKTHCKSCWRRLVGIVVPDIPTEIVFKGRKYILTESGCPPIRDPRSVA